MSYYLTSFLTYTNKTNYIFDFDSTFVTVESLDELFKISISSHPQKKFLIKEFESITDAGMNGEIEFSESFRKRMAMLKADKTHIEKLIKLLKKKISPSVKRNISFFKSHRNNIYIVSSGFKDYIEPILSAFGIDPKNIYANKLFYNNSKITGYDKKHVLTKTGGKTKLLKNLGLKGDIYVIGDGYSDLELKSLNVVKRFYAFTENVEREVVKSNADHIAPSLDEILYVNNLPMSISFPKNRIKVLLLEKVDQSAVEVFKKEGYKVEAVSGSLNEDELIKAIKDVSILGIRSKTNITSKVLSNANRLLTIGTFCIGTNQIDLKSAAMSGVPVFNAPYSNTRSVVELAIGEIIMLLRKTFDKSTNLHKGIWDKSAGDSFEVRGKKLGILGYGNIGSQLSVLAESLGMEVYFYDIAEKLPLGNAQKCTTLKELLKKSDIITLHIDGRPENKEFIGNREFKQMKDGVVFLNLSRGNVVSLESLRENLLSGKIKGAGIDVYPEEPLANGADFKTELQNMPNVILTPHIGGSTIEAQRNIASFVSGKVIDFINKGNTNFSVNFPNLQLPEIKKAHRLIHIHHNVPGIIAEMNSLFAQHKINIVGQYLKTTELIGYVITDIAKDYDKKLIEELKQIPNTIKFRILY